MLRVPRVVRRNPSGAPRLDLKAFRPAELLVMLRSYLGLGRAAALGPIDTPAALEEFLETRASFIAQTSLYGYIRTRAGLRYPELFDDEAFLVGINLAKWEIWLDCLGDLSVYCGTRIAQALPARQPEAGELLQVLVATILDRTGIPADSGPEFAEHADRIRSRLSTTHWLAVGPGEAAFTDSPPSVVRWAPIADGLKQLDEEIVLNSVRFRWQEVRRAFQAHADPAAILRGAA